MKKCFKCSIEKPLTEFYAHKMMKDGHLNKCKECTKRDVRKHRRDSPNPRAYDRKRYRDNPERRASLAEGVKRRAEAEPWKKKAHIAVGNAVRDGRLIKPDTCSRCGAGGRIEGHHHDYAKPLEVEWMCARCHKRHHFAKED